MIRPIQKTAFIIAVFFLFLQAANAQTWQECRDSADYYSEHLEYDKALEWREKALKLAEKELSEDDTNFINMYVANA